jgi:outer membrane receptor protein involved in Fe transport
MGILPLVPGVLQDGFGQVHVDGSESGQTFDQLDGFNINAVSSGAFTMRVNVDALRSVEVESSRYPVEYGKGSGGIISLRTRMGDDHFRFSGTDFLPSTES